MPWNWELPEWPKFRYDPTALFHLERRFLSESGGMAAVFRYLETQEQEEILLEILSSEGVESAKIEGEVLNRSSVQASIKRHFGVTSDEELPPKERGMGDLMWSQYQTFNEELSDAMLFKWHTLLFPEKDEIEEIGHYRTHHEPMLIISGRDRHAPPIFEAPPSKKVPGEMKRYIRWFNGEKGKETALARAAIAHLYFESIHPFEDGNGRIGRTLVEKVLSQEMHAPILFALSHTINRRKKEYYAELERCNRTVEIEGWVLFFSEVILEAQQEAWTLIDFIVKKAKFLTHFLPCLNLRQEKVIKRMLAEGVKGFSGGLSAENYMKISKSTRSTASRDLADLVKKKVLIKKGKLRHTRYTLNLTTPFL